MATARLLVALAAALSGTAWLPAQPATVTASRAWVAEPAAGSPSALAYLTIDNPTMYDVYVVSGTAPAAARVEFVDLTGDTEKRLTEITVPAYGSIELKPGGTTLRLADLTGALHAGGTVRIVLATDGGLTLTADAVVRAP